MRVQKSQFVFLIAYSVMHALTFLLTWEMVLHQGTAVELGTLPARAIENAGAPGLLLVVTLSYLIMLAFWSGWVLLRGRNSAMFSFFQALAVGSFAVAAVDFMHDALAFSFGYFDLAELAVFNTVSRFIIVGAAVFLVSLLPKLSRNGVGPGSLGRSIGRLEH